MDNVGFEQLGKANGDTERDIGKGATVSESSNSRNHLQHGKYIDNNHGLHFGRLLEILIVLITENQINLCFC